MRLALLLACVAAAHAQQFEVASVRLSGSKGVPRWDGPAWGDPTQLTLTATPMIDLLVQAYRVEQFQIEGPAWIRSRGDTYDIHATVPPGTTIQQGEVMMQNLLAERFHLRLHRVSKQFPVFDLIIAKGGPKFKASVIDPKQPPDVWEPPNGPPSLGADKFEKFPPGVPRSGVLNPRGAARMHGQQQPLSFLVFFASRSVGRPIIDKTGLTGKYDYKLFFDGSNGTHIDPDDPAPSLQSALEDQLGLKLVATKKPYDVLVIDHIDKVPVEN
jgi:uncharacterized protein (TIGR03435 family)